jgi:hypothetical protein
MEDYPANNAASRAPKPEAPELKKVDEKKIEVVVTGGVSRRKKPLSKRFTEMFFGDTLKSAAKYVFETVLLPATKDAIADMLSSGTERILYGDSRSPSRRAGLRSGRNSSDPVSYNRFHPSSQQAYRREDPRQARNVRDSHDFDDIILATRPEAEIVIGKMFDMIGKYEQASIADLYQMLGITPKYTDERWGWTDFRGAGVQRINGGGYLLDLPRPIPLD